MGKKNSQLSRLFSRQIFLTVLGLAVLTWISIPLAKNISQNHKIDSEVAKMQEEINRIEKKNSGLKELVSYLESDQFAEEQARLKLGLKKNGEQVVGIKETIGAPERQNPEPQSVFNMPGLDAAEPVKPDSNPVKWFKYFFDNSRT